MVSEKNARFLQSEVHGITVDDVVVRAYAGLDREQGRALAVRLCEAAESGLRRLRTAITSLTPFQRVGLVCRVMRAIRNLAE